MKAVYKIVLLIAVLLTISYLHTSCYSNVAYGPTEGVWYCNELQIQLSYDRSYESYIVENGEKLVCTCSNPRGVKKLSVYSQHRVHPDHPLMENVFSAEIISLNNNEFKVRADASGKEYVFVRINNEEKNADEFEIMSFFYEPEAERISVEYPQFVEDSAYLRKNKDYSAANILIEQEVINRTKAIADQSGEESYVRVGYLTSSIQKGVVSFLFQGGIYNIDNNIRDYFAFGVSVSVADGRLIDLSQEVNLDTAFAKSLKEAILSQPQNYRFTDLEWGESVDQITKYTDEELLGYLAEDYQGRLVMGKNEIVVIVPILHNVKYFLVALPIEAGQS